MCESGKKTGPPCSLWYHLQTSHWVVSFSNFTVMNFERLKCTVACKFLDVALRLIYASKVQIYQSAFGDFISLHVARIDFEMTVLGGPSVGRLAVVLNVFFLWKKKILLTVEGLEWIICSRCCFSKTNAYIFPPCNCVNRHNCSRSASWQTSLIWYLTASIPLHSQRNV